MDVPLIPRFIPTHVGNTTVMSDGSWFKSVHPHACGEHPSHRCHIQAVKGQKMILGRIIPVGLSPIFEIIGLGIVHFLSSLTKDWLSA